MRLGFLSNATSFFAVLLVTLLAGGCGEAEKPPTAISLEQIPTELRKVFASAKGETSELSDTAITAVEKKDFPRASTALTSLAQHPSLTKVQARTVAGAAMTINAALLEAESKGDPQAVEALNLRRMTK